MASQMSISLTLSFRFLKGVDVKVMQVPHFEGLRVKEILHWARQHTAIEDYLPELKPPKFISRDWLCNVGMALCIANI